MEQPSFLHKSGRAIMKTATSTKPGTRCLCLGAPRDRACARRERWGRWSFRAAARGGIGCRRSYARSGPVPLRLTYLVGRSAGPCLRSQGTLGQVELSRCRARGIIGSRRSYARSGPVPLRLTYFGGAPRSWGRLGVGPAYVSYAGPTPTVDPGVDSAVAPSCQPRALRGRG
jgi:hypothetical protein